MRGIVPLILISIFLSIAYYLYNSSLEYEQYSIILEEYRKEIEEKFKDEGEFTFVIDMAMKVLNLKQSCSAIEFDDRCDDGYATCLVAMPLRLAMLRAQLQCR